jgi:hypothetical protein
MLSSVVNWMIATKPIYGLMKAGAMGAMKSTTQKAGIDWDGHVRRMQGLQEVRCGARLVVERWLLLRRLQLRLQLRLLLLPRLRPAMAAGCCCCRGCCF